MKLTAVGHHDLHRLFQAEMVRAGGPYGSQADS